VVRALDLRLRASQVRFSSVPLSGNNFRQVVHTCASVTMQVIAPGQRDDVPLLMAGAHQLAANLHLSADGSAVCTSLVASQLQASSVPIA